jgi:hypothetical protein
MAGPTNRVPALLAVSASKLGRIRASVAAVEAALWRKILALSHHLSMHFVSAHLLPQF